MVIWALVLMFQDYKHWQKQEAWDQLQKPVAAQTNIVDEVQGEP